MNNWWVQFHFNKKIKRDKGSKKKLEYISDRLLQEKWPR